MDRRKEFLSKFWNRYPAIKAKALDVSGALSFLASEKLSDTLLTIGGRLFGSPGEFTLSSGGSTCAVQFGRDCQWSDASYPFDSSVFESGDIVLLEAKVVGVFDSAVLHVTKVQLLAPAFTKSKHNTSSDAEREVQWAQFKQHIRTFFISHGFMEAQTPTLVPSPGTEPYLDVFTTELVYGKNRKTFFLPTSPEFHLKKLLAQGHTRIFEIKNCFRNGELGEHHQPEFQMLEWYRAYSGLDAIIEDISAILNHLQKIFPQKKIENLKVVTMAELFAEQCSGFELRPDTSRDQLFELCERMHLRPMNDDTWDDLFFRVVIEKIEPSLDREIPTIVKNYPRPQAALARLSEDGWAQRFELYWRGLEIANAFDELNDPKQNEDRFKSDQDKRLKSGRETHPLDDELVECFYSAMPPAGGIALGVERLFMALFEIKDISQIRSFPIKF